MRLLVEFLCRGLLLGVRLHVDRNPGGIAVVELGVAPEVRLEVDHRRLVEDGQSLEEQASSRPVGSHEAGVGEGIQDLTEAVVPAVVGVVPTAAL